jgi:outer membrane biogenesis lipoprotein LolB
MLALGFKQMKIFLAILTTLLLASCTALPPQPTPAQQQQQAQQVIESMRGQ